MGGGQRPIMRAAAAAIKQPAIRLSPRRTARSRDVLHPKADADSACAAAPCTVQADIRLSAFSLCWAHKWPRPQFDRSGRCLRGTKEMRRIVRMARKWNDVC